MPRYRRSKLDDYAHLVGRIPDREVARMAGITPDGVRMYRQRHKIPSHGAFKRSLEPDLKELRRPKPAQRAGLRAYRVDAGIILAADIVEAARRASGTTRMELLGDVLEVK